MGIGSASKLIRCLGDNSTSNDGSGIMPSPGVKTPGHDDSAIVASLGANTTSHGDSAIVASPGLNTTSHDDSAIVASPGVNTTGHDDSAMVASPGVNTIPYDDSGMAAPGANTTSHDDSGMAVPGPGANTTSHDDSGVIASTEANTSAHDDYGIMASSGANTTDHDATTSSGANVCSYDVFLSFRGEDTRYSFTDHLYHALERSGILTFRDTDEINRGQELAPEIKRAIQASKASIIVLSENYATSTWCLDELWLILKQRKEYNHFVLPVFHHVDPSDVRNQRKTFDIKAKSSTRWTDDNIKRWKESLTLVASLSGLEVSGEETKLLNEIVDTIYNELDYKELSLPANLIGMDTRYEEIMSLLCHSNLQYVAICGMGGSGKTTLAKYIYNLNRKSFENMSFIENIGRRCKGPQDFLDLQKQLLKDILRGRERKVTSAFQGAVEIKEALQEKKAFIVLDDIVDPSQLATLFGSGEINPQSKIIITTEKTCNWGRSSSLQGQQYIMKLLNDDESLELINLHAFGSTIGDEDFKDLAVKATMYCEGNPLALEVLGSSLYNSNTIGQWKSELENLKKDIDYRITNVLERSYDSLRYEHEKELFLHIACFFIGMDKDYVEKILEPDYSAVFGIETLTNRCLISVSSDNKLRMHRLLQEMGKNIVHKESRKHPANRSRVWLSKESYKILKNGNGSKTIEGLIFDMEMLKKEDVVLKISKLKTDALQNMDNLKLLQLNSVELSGSYEHFSEDLRWLCWIGFHLDTIPSGLFIGKLVVLDMTYGKLEVFDPPVVLPSLKILNLKDSCLREIGHISRMPNLETLILWNCYNLVYVCKTIGDLKCLSLLNMTGCTNLFDRANIEPLAGLKASSSGGEVLKHLFPLPCSLQKLFLNECESKCTDSLSLSLSVQPFLQYLNLSSNLFEVLPSYGHLKNLRVLDLIFCRSLKWLLCLPSTLAELYVDFCKSLEKVTFQSRRFTLQEFGYSGCCNLHEVEGLFKLVPIAKLDETELGHMKWLSVYQYHSVLLAGDYDLTTDRSQDVQMLYQFDIMSTSLPNIKDSNLRPEYISESSSLSFYVPSCPKNKKLKGLDVTFKYALSGDDWVWFAKVSTTNGVDLMYNPMVFGKPGIGEVGIWLSYWPIGSTLDVGDKVNVSIVVLSGLVEVLECGASLVYSNDKAADETVERNMDYIETLGGDLSRFELRAGAYYLCRCDLFTFMEVDRLTPGWLSVLVGENIDDTAVRGWRKNGRPRQMSQPFTELKTVGCIIHDPPLSSPYLLKLIREWNVNLKSRLSSSLACKAASSSLAQSGTPPPPPPPPLPPPPPPSINPVRRRRLLLLRSIWYAAVASSSTLKFQVIFGKHQSLEKKLSLSISDLSDPSTTRNNVNFSEDLRNDCYTHVIAFTLFELETITRSFKSDYILGQGGFGTVYKGYIDENVRVGLTSLPVAVKVVNKEGLQGHKEWLTEVNFLGQLRHPNLVKLIGYCCEDDHRLLVYEFMSRGSLENHLFRKTSAPLSWSTRMGIALGAAEGLAFLHRDERPVIFRDFKTSNILLDSDYTAKLSDFGYTKAGPQGEESHVSARVIGTYGYAAPEYVMTGHLTARSDVYSFGVVLLELLTGRRTLDKNRPSKEQSLVDWARPKLNNKRKLLQIVDPRLKSQYSVREVQKACSLAYYCLSQNPKERPLMSDVAVTLCYA